jgi:hypothetical protein
VNKLNTPNDTTTANDSPAEVQDLDAIAAGLVADAKPTPRSAPPKKEAEPRDTGEQAPEPADVEDDRDDDDAPDGGDTDRDFMDDLTAAEAAEDVAEDDGDDADDPEPEDSRTVRVKRNGEFEEVSIADLKKNWSGKVAIDARVQEAAEARNAAKAEREAAAEALAQSKALSDRLAHAYQHYNTALFAPQVARPDPSMQQEDPIGYFGQMEAYRADQERLQNEQAAMQQTLQQASTAYQAQRRERLAGEAEALRTKLPGLKDPAKAKAFKEKIAAVAQAHGFTPEELSMADDHRLLMIAMEAAMYRELKASLQSKRTPAAETVRRPMPTRGDNRQHGEKSRKSNRQRRVMAKAQETGSVDDVSLTLLI